MQISMCTHASVYTHCRSSVTNQTLVTQDLFWENHKNVLNKFTIYLYTLVFWHEWLRPLLVFIFSQFATKVKLHVYCDSASCEKWLARNLPLLYATQVFVVALVLCISSTNFLKMASTTHATFKNTSHPHFFGGGIEMWFKYQNNEQNLQLWDMQIFQIAKF